MSEPEEPGALNERGRALQDAGDISGASDLTVTERDLILRCVRAAASGELFPLAEAEYRVGVKQAELKSLLASPAGIGGSGYESPGFFAVDLCLAHARDVRRASRLVDVPETPDIIEAPTERSKMTPCPDSSSLPPR